MFEYLVGMRLLGDYIYLVAQLTYALIGVAQQRLFVGEREQMLRLMVGRQGPEPSAFTTCDYYYYHARNYSTQKPWLLDTTYARMGINGGMYIGPKTNMKKHTNRTDKKRKKAIAIAAAIVVALLVGGLIYRSTRAESPDVMQGKISKDEKKSDSSIVESDSQGSTETPTMTSQNPATPPATQSNSLPAPILAKSSGNNGSIPTGVLVNFTCSSTPGYFCEVKLEKSGGNTIVLEKKVLIENRGSAAASWNWESISGKWSVTAVLSNSSGQTKSSAAQTLEVR
jgi:hypothetical protein